MRRLRQAMAAIFMLLGLTACSGVSTIPLEPQSKQRDARQARLYFIWPRSAMLRTSTLDVKVDGQVVGKIAPDSYFFIDRQPGTYTLRVEPPFDWVYFEADAPVAAGGTYYYAINVKPAVVPITGGGVLGVVAVIHPQIGTPMQTRESSMRFATYKLRSVDPATAAAEMAKLESR